VRTAAEQAVRCGQLEAGLCTNLKRHGYAARAGKEWSDGQVERAGEDITEVSPDFLAQVEQAVAACDTKCSNGHHRHADACD
jgi:hypothetical protein